MNDLYQNTGLLQREPLKVLLERRKQEYIEKLASVIKTLELLEQNPAFEQLFDGIIRIGY